MLSTIRAGSYARETGGTGAAPAVMLRIAAAVRLIYPYEQSLVILARTFVPQTLTTCTKWQLTNSSMLV